MTNWQAIAGLAGGIVLAPFLQGVINRVKAVFAGRRGQPLLQAYSDLWKLLNKGAVYSSTTTGVFRAMPSAVLAVALLTLAMVPAGSKALLSFEGDIFVLAYMFGLMRFFTVIAALDTGSSFEGMGASREVTFSAIAEPALFIALATLSCLSGSISLSGMIGGLSVPVWRVAGLSLVLVAVVFSVIALAENCRIPFDDPNTHLELTMIHEVMVLDHSGPDFGLVQYAASLKLWTLSALVVNLFVPLAGLKGMPALAVFVGGMLLFAVLIGVVESIMARFALLKVPRVLAGALAVAILSAALAVRICT